MKHRLLWTHAATATVGFALCWALTPKLNPSQEAATAAAQAANSSSSNSTSSQAAPSEEATSRTRVAKRDEKKKPSERSVTLPLAKIAGIIRERSQGDFDFQKLQDEMESSLTLLGASEREKNDIHKLLKDIGSEISAEGIRLLKPFQFNESEIRFDNRAMKPFSKTIAPKIQEGIRASLSADLADVLISSTQWDKLYPTGEESFPAFSITRKPEGILALSWRERVSSNARSIDKNFIDDGTPISLADLIPNGHSIPSLKGLTLLPKDDE